MKILSSLLSLILVFFIFHNTWGHPLASIHPIDKEVDFNLSLYDATCYESYEGEEVYFELLLQQEEDDITGYLYMKVFDDISYAAIFGVNTGEEYLTLDFVMTDENGNPLDDNVSQAILKFNGDNVELNIGEVIYFEPVSCE